MMMAEVSRQQFLRQVRQSVGRAEPHYAADEGTPAEPLPPRDPAMREELSPRFVGFLQEAGAMVHRAGNAGEVRSIIREVCEKQGVRTAVAWDHPLLHEASVFQWFEEVNVDLLIPSMRDDLVAKQALSQEMAADISPDRPAVEARPGSRQVVDEERARLIAWMAQADLGLTGVDYGVADGGTLVLLSGEDRARGASLLPPVHIALVSADQIAPNLEEVFAQIRESQPPGRIHPYSCLALISGPSKSGDVEQTLALGAHGPKELHVILWERDDGMTSTP